LKGLGSDSGRLRHKEKDRSCERTAKNWVELWLRKLGEKNLCQMKNFYKQEGAKAGKQSDQNKPRDMERLGYICIQSEQGARRRYHLKSCKADDGRKNGRKQIGVCKRSVIKEFNDENTRSDGEANMAPMAPAAPQIVKILLSSGFNNFLRKGILAMP
jgi:hypothetical protein